MNENSLENREKCKKRKKEKNIANYRLGIKCVYDSELLAAHNLHVAQITDMCSKIGTV